MRVEDKIKRLEDYLRNKKSVLAFSAGSDSTLIAYILSQVSPNSLLVTIDNNMMPKEFIAYTIEQASKYNLKHKIIKLDFLKDKTFQNNGKERCYECRKIMYSNIQNLPEFNDYDYFLEGTNITDLLEDRPGILVREMFNMTSPLIECNITKEDVYEMIKYFNLEYSSDTTCLATRVKTNQNVNQDKLERIYDAEKYVKSLVNQENIRVRIDNNNATISIDNPLEILDQNLLIKLRNKLRELGFKKVLLDITGYEKTELEYSIDSNGNYYYQLPYPIDLEKTKENIELTIDIDENLKLDNNLYYDNIVIEENGKITMSSSNDFVDRVYQLLRCIKRKNI